LKLHSSVAFLQLPHQKS